MKIKYIASLDKRASDINSLIRKDFPEILETKKPELILLAGGDGAMMHAIREYHNLDIPFLGIARGTFNFLMNEVKQEKEFLNNLLNNNLKLHLQQTQMIKILHNNKELGYAVNDIVIGTSITGYHTFEINTQDQTLANLEVKGSGLCISTDLGSTAYSYNLGNPAIPLNNQLLIISGIVCNKYINDIVKIQKITIKLKSDREECNLYFDGIKQKMTLKKDDEIIIKKGKSIKIAFTSLKEFKEKRRRIYNRHRNFN